MRKFLIISLFTIEVITLTGCSEISTTPDQPEQKPVLTQEIAKPKKTKYEFVFDIKGSKKFNYS